MILAVKGDMLNVVQRSLLLCSFDAALNLPFICRRNNMGNDVARNGAVLNHAPAGSSGSVGKGGATIPASYLHN